MAAVIFLIVAATFAYLGFGWALCEAERISLLWIPLWPLVLVLSN